MHFIVLCLMDEIEMLQAHAAVGYYESMEGTTCPEYPGF